MTEKETGIGQQKVLALLKDFCEKKLDAEYLDLSERLANKLGRTNNEILESGKPTVWAAAIIHALGTINFLFVNTFKPYVTVAEINRFFGTNRKTSEKKCIEIIRLFNLDYYDKEFSIEIMRGDFPFGTYKMVKGRFVLGGMAKRSIKKKITKLPPKPVKIVPIDDSLGLFD